MRKEIKYTTVVFFAIFTAFNMACKKRDIKGEEITVNKVTLSMASTDGKIVVPTDSNYSQSGSKLMIPLDISFSDAAPSRFNVNVAVNNDTVNALIANGQLPNTVLIPSEFYELPNNLDILFGADHIDFNLVVDITAIERNYGKNLALAVELSDPTKSNTIVAGKKTVIVVINTDKVIKQEDIHYISFAAAGQLLNIPEEDKTYAQDASSLTVPVDVSLAGTAGSAFNVSLEADPDTVQHLLDMDSLTNTVLLQSGNDYQLPSQVQFAENKNQATFNLNVNVDALKNNKNKKVALALTLSNPSSHLLDSVKKTVVIVLDPAKLVESDITNDSSTLTVQRENVETGETSPNVIDNDISTKYLLFNFTSVWIQLQYPSPRYAGAYTLTSANDAQGRDPKSWQLLGSNDGSSWTVLDTRTNEAFQNRFQTNKYTFSNKKAYSYYRLNITANAGDGLFQLAEWRLIRRP